MPDTSKDIALDLPNEPDPFKGPDSWNGDPPQPGKLSGTVIERGEVTTDKHGGATVPLLRIRNGNGDVMDVPCWRVHLRQLVEENEVTAGDTIAIRAFGARPGELQKLYAVSVQKGGGSDADIPF
jgi:hypothetical protein